MSGALGLGGYSSSDDEDESIAPVSKPNQAVATKIIGEALPEVVLSNPQHADPTTIIESTTEPQQDSTPDPADEPAPASSGPALGPALGPMAGPAAGPSMPEAGPSAMPSEEDDGSIPSSPYTAGRLMLRNLTMPPVPNFQIPPSPPGSPPPDTTTKFARFLDLKKKGTHFNERLYHSSALRNPGLLPKLMDFAGISQEDQYATPWSQGAIATKFPDWAYGDKLVAAHEKIAKKKEQEKAKNPREAVDFVPAKQEANASASGRVERRTQGRRGLGFDNERRRSRSPR
ncbi:hypothetical protein D6C90_05850 [Aureobasidium pullulans]|uniref:HCNGP-domain-containing protein n=1 Tax=Aureobasidium pullulans TaxID=5580 RepID=A0A4S9I9Y0_AURPU|nr:hypothetical protein D6D04_02676 [Aureobasidium pullulans]THZ40386.1 hypothetical protein D6C90_05850 [Aureobasidium pullulans]